MISFQEAQNILKSNVPKPKPVRMALSKAMYHYLSTEVRSDSDIPNMDNSALDGFAGRFDDVSNIGDEPAKLKVVGTIRAGYTPSKSISPGEVVRIMSGAIVPKGADVIIPVEEAREEQNFVYVYRAPRSRGDHIRRAGEDIAKNGVVLKTGDRLGPAEIALAYLAGVSKISVYQKPTVGLITFGDELVEPGRKLKKGKVRNINTHLLGALLSHLQIPSLNHGIVKDNPRRIVSAIRSAFQKCDVVVTSGGISAGQYDFVRSIVETKLKMKILFHKVRQKPGRPMMIARKGNQFLFSLPGNPVSTFVSFLLYVRPFVLGMSGMTYLDMPKEYAEASEPIGSHPRFTNFLRGRIYNENDKLFVRTTGPQESHLVTSLYGSNCLIVLPEGRLSVQPGEVIEVWKWR